jgi:hypothetical protein
MTKDEFVTLALAVDGAVEASHFGKRDFRIGKRIFASLPEDGRAVLNFTPDRQAMLCELEPACFVPLPNAWGAKGWTSLLLAHCPEEVAASALAQAADGVRKGTPKRR